MYKTGVIHGRFQILHNDHMKYLLAGLEKCEHLVIGITNPDPTHIKFETSDPKRSEKMANPLSYFQRYQLIHTAFAELNISKKRFSVVPFPINFPELYRYYVPMDAVFFLSIYDDWGREKLSKFKELNLDTFVLWEVTPEEKGISASKLRSDILLDNNWQKYLPESVFNKLMEWDIKNILNTLIDS